MPLCHELQAVTYYRLYYSWFMSTTHVEFKDRKYVCDRSALLLVPSFTSADYHIREDLRSAEPFT